jgi:hypothetical protein
LARLKRAARRWETVLITWWYAQRGRLLWIFCVIAALGTAILLIRYWGVLAGYLCGLEKSVLPELAIGIGAAITGIIAIAFSLSLFAIQQVVERGTPGTVQAYARDSVLTLIYSALTVLAITCFAVALLKEDGAYHAVTAIVPLLSLFLSFILLNFHFRRIMKFADPRYTVFRIYKQGQKQLKRLQILRETIGTSGIGSSDSKRNDP